MNARELAAAFTLEQLREAFDAISTGTLVLNGDAVATFTIAGQPVETTATAIGEAKLLHRTDLMPTRRPRRTRRH